MRDRFDGLWSFYFEDGAIDEVWYISQSDILVKGKRGLIVSLDGDAADGVMQFPADGKEKFGVGLLWVDTDSMLSLCAADANDDWAIHYAIGLLRSF